MSFFKYNYLGDLSPKFLKLSLFNFFYCSLFFFKKTNELGSIYNYFLEYKKGYTCLSVVSFLFLSRYMRKNLILNFLIFLNESFVFVKKRVKIKGLGFRLKKISKYLWRFFFGLCVFFYLHTMSGLNVYSRGRFLLVLSSSYSKVGNFLADLKKLFRKKIKHYKKSSNLIDENSITFFYKKLIH